MAITDTLGVELPDIGLSGPVGMISIVAIILFTIGILGVVVYFVIRFVKFKKKIIIWEKISGNFEPSRKDRAMFVRFGEGGDQLFFLRKLKKYVPVPEIQTGRNTYHFFLRQDGELINMGFEDFDEQSKKLGAKFLDKEMRYARVSLQGHWKERYDKPKFWEKYGTLIINIVLMVIILGFVFLILDSYLDSQGAIQDALKTTAELQEVNKEVLGAIDNVCSGSGIVKK